MAAIWCRFDFKFNAIGMSFLKAEWKKLAIANYQIDKELLIPYLPNGTEIDRFDGACYVSLVGFMFLNTKVLGMKIPFHTNFEEVNLRFYVKREDSDEVKRGVVFIKEIVPRMAISFIANTLYKENYESMKMDHEWKEINENSEATYRWKSRNRWNTFSVDYNPKAQEIEPNSNVEFITEHYWGYARVHELVTNEYEVTHPKWHHYHINDYKIDVDFGETYGQKFSFLNNQKPNSVMLAEGSEITVENKTTLKFS